VLGGKHVITRRTILERRYCPHLAVTEIGNLPNNGEGDALISAHIVQLEQTPPSSMALPSGIYTIQNVEYRNWAMLFDGNEGKVVAGSSPHANVGEKVRTLEI